MKLIYIAHPFGGCPKAVSDVQALIADLHNTSLPMRTDLEPGIVNKCVFVSPLLQFGFRYSDTPYVNGLDKCLELLNRCDILLLSGDWEASRGCMAEYAFAKAKGIPIHYERRKNDDDV